MIIQSQLRGLVERGLHVIKCINSNFCALDSSLKGFWGFGVVWDCVGL